MYLNIFKARVGWKTRLFTVWSRQKYRKIWFGSSMICRAGGTMRHPELTCCALTHRRENYSSGSMARIWLGCALPGWHFFSNFLRPSLQPEYFLYTTSVCLYISLSRPSLQFSLTLCACSRLCRSHTRATRGIILGRLLHFCQPAAARGFWIIRAYPVSLKRAREGEKNSGRNKAIGDWRCADATAREGRWREESFLSVKRARVLYVSGTSKKTKRERKKSRVKAGGWLHLNPRLIIKSSFVLRDGRAL